MIKLAMTIILLCTFVFAFYITTFFTDAICRHTGYYEPGLQDDMAIQRGEY